MLQILAAGHTAPIRCLTEQTVVAGLEYQLGRHLRPALLFGYLPADRQIQFFFSSMLDLH